MAVLFEAGRRADFDVLQACGAMSGYASLQAPATAIRILVKNSSVFVMVLEAAHYRRLLGGDRAL